MTPFRHAPDVTAVVLTTGEPTTQRALDSLHRQTTPVSDIIVVRDTHPMHKALNAGARQVRTPFFIQVDADMVLDPSCVTTLRKAMSVNVGISVGRLRDAMVQQVVGIKMFRTACFEIAEFRDSISPDTDFVEEIERAGWQTVYVGKRGLLAKGEWKTLGEHDPDYAPPYVYRKYLMEGRRYRHRNSRSGLRWHLRQLEQSRHRSALTAQVALSRGFFRESDRDELGCDQDSSEFERLRPFLLTPSDVADVLDRDSASDPPSQADQFRQYYRIGREIFEDGDVKSFHSLMTRLNDRPQRSTTWICKLALCQGLLATSSNDAIIESDLSTLSDFLSAAQVFSPSPAPNDPVDSQPQPELQLDNIVAYASSIGLERFAIAPIVGARNGMLVDAGWTQSADGIVAWVDAKGRPRIKVPFRLGGHIVCTDPERVGGLFWCMDLLKAGYLFAHIPTPLGARRAMLPRLLVRNAGARFGWYWGLAPLSRQAVAALRKMAKRRTPSYQPKPGVALMVADSLAIGGSERQMVALSAGLLRKGYKVEVLSLMPLQDGAPSFEQNLLRLGITPAYAGAAPPLLWTYPAPPRIGPADWADIPKAFVDRILAIASAIERCQPGIVHGWLDGPGVAAALAGCMLGAPAIVVQQASMSSARRRVGSVELLRHGYRELARNSAVTILNNSEAGARDNEQWIGLRPGSIGVIYNGVAPESARVTDIDEIIRTRQALGLPADALVVGTVMRFVPEKDPGLWIDTAAEIARARSNVRFLVAGYGPLEDTIKSRIQTLGLRDRVTLAGAVSDAGPIYGAMDVVLLTSAVEGIPNVMLEAQALGRPVVAPNVGGIREALLEGRTGIIVQTRTAQSFTRAVTSLLDDTAWRQRVLIEGPEFVAHRFGFDRMVDDTMAFYKRTRT
jgi:glycosyltransferase involved in cell wall biosynthesis